MHEGAPVVLLVGADAKYLFQFRGAVIGALRQRGFRPVVLTQAAQGWGREEFAGIGAEFVDWDIRKAGLNPLQDIAALRTLWRTLRDLKPAIVFAHTIKSVIYAMIVSRLAGVKRRVAMIPGLGYAFTDGKGLRRRIISLVARTAYSGALRSAHTVIFQNPDDRADLVAAGILPAGAHAVIVQGSGVDMDRFCASPPPAGPITFLMVARLIRDKGVYEFVEAARLIRRQMPDVRFLLAGAPDHNPAAVQRAEIESWAAEGIVEMLGHLPDPQPAYAQSHVFVLPSYYREGTPRTNLEAMASARPVITADTPGCRQTVTHGVNGFLVPPRDPVALSEMMLKFARDRDLVRTMGDAGRRICAERYELHKVTGSTVAHMLGEDRGRNH
jgi:glycosyltransferase involved in cell wall biosynthesis